MTNTLLAMLKNLLLVGLTLTLLSASPKNKTENRFEPLPPHSVQLNGYLNDYIQNSITHWNKGPLPYSQFVDFFRNGRPQFALGEMWGKSVRSACMLYRYTQDPELKQIIEATVNDLLSTQRANGSISCVEIDKQPEASELWERKYVMLGLEEYYHCVNPDPRVLNALKKQADNIISLVGPWPKTDIVDIGWSATNIGHEPCHIESSSLLEPFMRLYNLTHEQRYLDFAAYIIKMGGTKEYNIFEMALNNVEPYKMAGHYPKAYEMLSIFEGLTEYYRVTQKPEIKQMILNLYENVRTKEITIIGNGGSDQPYHPQVMGEAWGNTAFEQTNPTITRMMETCVGVTWMKFCSQVLRLTGDPSAVDEIEKYVYNGLIGAMNPSGGGFSYVNLLNGKKVNGEGWGWKFDQMHVTCCNLNGPMALAYIPWVAAMKSPQGLAINLYNQGTIQIQTPRKNNLKIDIKTNYPQSGQICMEIDIDRKEKFNLKLRIPQWSKNSVVKVNGKSCASVTPGSYLELSRKWKKGDQIEIHFDMTCTIINAPKGSNRAGNRFQALKRGPVILARDQNIDPNYDKPITLVGHTDGTITIEKVTPTLKGTRMEFDVPTTDGKIRMVDYASVNGWNGSSICTWLPMK